MKSPSVLGYDGLPYTIGDKVELSPRAATHRRGDKYGECIGLSAGDLPTVLVRSDNPAFALLAGVPTDFKKRR